MEFFNTSEGRLHFARIAGVLYAVGLLVGCVESPRLDRRCIMRITYTAGWWLSFCDKGSTHAVSALVNVRRLCGILLVLIGLIGSFYLLLI
jgi:hypothetical protein